MPLEIEIKLKLDNHDQILKQLRQLHARHIQTVKETNIFFDTPTRTLLKKGSGLRVRLEQPLHLKSQISNLKSPATALLTFKGPPQKRGLHSRYALDLTTTPANQLIPLLQSLGLRQVLLFEKIRDSWQLDRCKIELDTLPHFGHFLEIEGPTEKAVKAVQKKLHLHHLPQFKTGYARLTESHLAPKKKKELRFHGRRKP